MKDRFCVALMAGVIALPLFTAGVLAADAPPPPPPAHTGEQQGKTDGAKKTAESGESDAKKAGKDVKNGATKAGKDVKHGLEKFGQDVSDFFHGVFD